ncbi:MAG: hypothetical protein WCO25_05165 [Candidatus Uhrbacteria bacterium]
MRTFEPITGPLGLDHVALPYLEDDGVAHIVDFWESLGMKVTRRTVTERIDHAGPGERLDVGSVSRTHVVYFPGLPVDQPGHVAFAVSQHDFKRLLGHPAIDTTQGDKGLIRWGTNDASLFLVGPYDVRFEFHCANAPTDILSQPG